MRVVVRVHYLLSLSSPSVYLGWGRELRPGAFSRYVMSTLLACRPSLTFFEFNLLSTQVCLAARTPRDPPGRSGSV